MHRGYGPVRRFLDEYGLGETEVELAGAWRDQEPSPGVRISRMVWDLGFENDMRRRKGLGQDFNDWVLLSADEVQNLVRIASVLVSIV